MAKKGCIMGPIEWLIPLLQTRDNQDYIDLVHEKDRSIRRNTANNAGQLELLVDAVEETRANYKYILPTFRAVDTVDKAMAIVKYPLNAVLTFFGLAGIGGAIGTGENILEAAYKVPATGWYWLKTKDYAGTAKLGGLETLSTVAAPCGAELLDVANLYTGTLYDRMTYETIGRYYQKLEDVQHRQRTALPDPTAQTADDVVQTPELVQRDRPREVIDGGVLEIPGDLDEDGFEYEVPDDIQWE